MVLLHFLVVVYGVLVEEIPGFDIFHIASLTITPRARDMSECGRRTSAMQQSIILHSLCVDTIRTKVSKPHDKPARKLSSLIPRIEQTIKLFFGIGESEKSIKKKRFPMPITRADLSIKTKNKQTTQQ